MFLYFRCVFFKYLYCTERVGKREEKGERGGEEGEGIVSGRRNKKIEEVDRGETWWIKGRRKRIGK